MEMVGGLEVATEEEGESVARASGLSAHGEGGEAEALSAGGREGGAEVRVCARAAVVRCCAMLWFHYVAAQRVLDPNLAHFRQMVGVNHEGSGAGQPMRAAGAACSPCVRRTDSATCAVVRPWSGVGVRLLQSVTLCILAIRVACCERLCLRIEL